MPEGDTVWLTAKRLHAALGGQQVRRFELRMPQLIGIDLCGDTVEEVVPRGKHLLMRFASGRTLHSHLRMDGSWHLSAVARPRHVLPGRYMRALVGTASWLAAGYRVHDLCVVSRSDEPRLVGHLGPDLLGPDWDQDEAVRRLRTQLDRPVGEALLDQRNLAGIGNLYKSETLFVTHVDPWTPVGEIADLDRIVATARRLMLANREHPAQSTTGLLARGRQHWVYGRAGEGCLRCRTPIQRRDQGQPPNQRSTYWCPGCQQRAAPDQTA